MKVSSGCVFAKFLTAMPSSPESGESRIWTLSCSISLRTARTAESGVASVDDDELEFLVADLLAQYVERGLVAANAVFTEHRVGAFQGCGDTNLDFLLGERSPRKQQGAQRN